MESTFHSGETLSYNKNFIPAQNSAKSVILALDPNEYNYYLLGFKRVKNFGLNVGDTAPRSSLLRAYLIIHTQTQNIKVIADQYVEDSDCDFDDFTRTVEYATILTFLKHHKWVIIQLDMPE